MIPRVPVRQWVLSFPLPLRYLLAAHADLLAPILKVVNRTVSTQLIDKAGFRRGEAKGGAVKLIQRFGSAANVNIHPHALVLDGVYREEGDAVVFHAVWALAEKKRCVSVYGFSLPANARQPLERLCRYITHPWLASSWRSIQRGRWCSN